MGVRSVWMVLVALFLLMGLATGYAWLTNPAVGTGPFVFTLIVSGVCCLFAIFNFDPRNHMDSDGDDIKSQYSPVFNDDWVDKPGTLMFNLGIGSTLSPQNRGGISDDDWDDI